MSIPQITYGNGGPYVDGVDEVLTPQIIYFPPGESNHWSLRSSGEPISITVNASSSSDPTTDLELMTLSNGCRVVLTYRLYVTDYTGGITYHFSWVMKLLDKDDTVIEQNGGSSSINKGSLDPNDPFLEAHMNGGVVSYGTNRPTTLDEEAIQYYPICAIYTKRPNQLVPESFIGNSRTSTFEGTWIRTCHLAPISNSAGYDAFIGNLVAGGDGSNPVTPDEPEPKPPAGESDTSKPGGGGGNYDDTSDPIDFPELPVGGAIESGAVIAHRVTKQTLIAIFSKLWNVGLIDSWLKSIQDPMDAIVSLHALPVTPEVTNDPNNIYIGNLDMEVSSPIVTSQYVEVDCGSLSLKEFWGSALDYSPYTRIEIFLPFIGVRTLRTEDVMKSTLEVKYYIDVLTGDCIAFIKCGISVLYTYNGNCKMPIPLSARSSDALQKIVMATGLAVAAGSVAVGGGAAAAAATKAPQMVAAGITQEAAYRQAGSLMISGASTVASTKINTSRSGDISGSLGLMGEFIPYVIIHRPVQSLAKDYNKFKGYTSNLTKTLGELSGYTEVEHINLQGIPNATSAEMDEIKALLMSGVIF